MKKLSLILISVLLILTLAACGDKCEHTYDNACDATCNECGETREVSAHNYADATCTAPKTCTVCGATDGQNKDHIPENDDNDCSTALNCGVCGKEILAAGEHSPEEDDGNCTTEQKCTVCGQTVVSGKAEHIDSNHDYICDNGDCQITLDGAPKDENEGIDLPLVPNN